jgi:hypothetical protein
LKGLSIGNVEPYVVLEIDRRKLIDDQGVIQGVILRLVIRELSLYMYVLKKNIE